MVRLTTFSTFLTQVGLATWLSTTTGCEASDDDPSSGVATAGPGESGEATTGNDGSDGTVGNDGSGGTVGSDGTDTSGPPDPDATGEELYAKRCASCHGDDAMGTNKGYELRHPVRGYAAWVVRNGRTGPEFPGSKMAAYPTTVVSDAQLQRIFDYLDAFPQPTTGEGLYFDYCRNCHGVDARGGVVGEEARKNYGDILEKVREGNGGSNYGSRGKYMPAWGQAKLSDDELRQIAEAVGKL